MNTNLLKQLRHIIEGRRTKLNVRLVIFVFFLSVATILWYLNKLSYEYSTEISFPLKFENLPKGKVAVGEVPSSITLGVKAFGYTLLRYQIGSALMPININLNQVVLIPVSGSDSKYFILTARARNNIANQLKGDLMLERVMPDSLFFEFTTLAEKRVLIKPNLSFTLDRQHMQAGPISVSPDSITISGPQTLVDTIHWVTTVPIRFDKLTETENRNVDLKLINQIGFSNRKVNINIPVERFTEAIISKPIDIKNLPDSIRLVLIPRAVSVKCNVAISRFRGLADESLEAFVDYNDVKSSFSNQLRVQISSKPFHINNLSFEPKYVEFIIEKQ
jgi:hypothetical protein